MEGESELAKQLAYEELQAGDGPGSARFLDPDAKFPSDAHQKVMYGLYERDTKGQEVLFEAEERIGKSLE